MTLRLARAVCTSLVVSFALAACGGGAGVDVNPATADETGSTGTGSITRATISGTPASSVTVGAQYSFTPSASASDGGALTYAVTNAPAWASFNAKTGQLSGSPKTTDIGTTTNIVITATDGGATASLPAFSVVVVATVDSGAGSAKVSWVAPTENINGTALTNLAGYYVYYGTDPNGLTDSVQVSNPQSLSYQLTGLATGTTWYFAVASYTSSGQTSELSVVSSKSL